MDRSRVNMAANNRCDDRLAEVMAVQNPSPSINDSTPGRILDRVLDSLNERERIHGRLEPTNQAGATRPDIDQNRCRYGSLNIAKAI